MPYFNLRPDFITVLLDKNLARLQLFVIILNCITISDQPQQAQDVNAVLFTLLFIIPRIALLSSTQPEAETLDFSTHALPRNLLKIFPPYEHRQGQHCQAIW